MKMKLIIAASMMLSVITAAAQDEARRLDSLVQSYAEQSEFTGTVLVATTNGVLLYKGYGYSDAAAKVPNGKETVYNIASLTKMFTAAIILKLQEQKKLSVNDRLSKYFPTYPNGEGITIHQLLTHTSGIFNYTEDRRFQSMDQSKGISTDSMLHFFQNKPLDFAPGSQFHYSNSGYTLLGLIIEKVTGLSYGDALSRFIFRPLGMTHSSYGPPVNNDLVASPYGYYFKNFQQHVQAVHPSISYATGAIYSTAEDLYKWNLALQGGQFLSKASLQSAYTKDKGNYGYGWFTDSLYGRQRVSHDGNIAGYKANINRMPGDSVCIIALANSGNSNVGRMVRDLVNILYNKPLSVPFAAQPVINIPDSVQRSYAADFQYGDEGHSIIQVKSEGSNLVLHVPGANPAILQPMNRNQFKAGNRRVEFQITDKGKVVQIIVYDNGAAIGGARIE